MYQIFTDFERPSADLIERANRTFVGVTGTHAGPRQVMHPAIKPINPEWRVCGPAFTVRPEYPEDLLMGEIAAKWAQPGDVIVVDAAGKLDVACWGAGMTTGARDAQANGVVVDGAAMNSTSLLRYGVPVFCRGLVAGAAGTNDKPGWINVPVICGGVIVNPGDIILGDADGVIVLPKDRADAILKRSEGYRTRDQAPPPDPVPYYISRNAETKLAAHPNVEIR